MSLLIKALKKAEQKHLEATALALEQVSLDPTVIAAADAATPRVSVPAPTLPTPESSSILPENHVLSIENPPPVVAPIEEPVIKMAVPLEVPKPKKPIAKDLQEPATLKRWLSLFIFVGAATATAVGYLFWQTQSVPKTETNQATSQLALDLAQTTGIKPQPLTDQRVSAQPADNQETKKTPVAFTSEPKSVEKKKFSEPDDQIDTAALKSEPLSIKPTSVPIPGPKLIRQDSNDRIGKLLELAFSAQSKQDNSQAMQMYEQILELDKNNLDALLGKASLVAKNGDTAGATRLYGRVLELEPNDSSARSALASLRTIVDPEGQESNLRNLLAKDPTQPSLLFALGNTLAAQGRWSEAQTVYFQAYSGDNQQPDYAFNLAISLERIRQNSLALNYYRSALELTQTKSARFKIEQARQRIAALEKPLRIDASDSAKE